MLRLETMAMTGVILPQSKKHTIKQRLHFYLVGFVTDAGIHVFLRFFIMPICVVLIFIQFPGSKFHMKLHVTQRYRTRIFCFLFDF